MIEFTDEEMQNILNAVSCRQFEFTKRSLTDDVAIRHLDLEMASKYAKLQTRLLVT